LSSINQNERISLIMAIESLSLLFDCKDPVKLAQFWAAALNYELDKESGPEGAGINDLAGHKVPIEFYPVPEGKTVKNRLHIDLTPTDSRAAEVERLKGLDATEVTAFPNWTVLADPEGNEFCVLRSAAERK
jgi:hypothetical protein